MSVPIVADAYVGIRKEESFASGGAVTAFQPAFSSDLQPNKVYAHNDFIMATMQQVGGRIMHQSVTGSVTFPVSPSNSQIWWECGIGGTSSPYTPGRPLKSMVIHEDKSKADMYTSGDMVASLEISSAAGGVLQCVATIEGKGFQNLAAGASSFTSGDDPYLHTEGVFEFDDVANSDIMSISVSANNNLITDLYGNQKERRDIPATKTAVTGTFTKLFQDTDMRNKFLQELPVKIEATYSRGANSFKYTLIKVKFADNPAPLSGQSDYISETFNFTAYVDDAANEKVIQIDVT